MEDLKKAKITLTFDEIKKMKKFSFKKLVRKNCDSAALEYLNNLKDSHSKLDRLSYKKLQIQPYLTTKLIYPQMSQQIFKWRTRMENFKMNFSNKYDDLSCIFGCMEDDSQENILHCKIVANKIDVSGVNYFNIFSNDIENIKGTMKVLLKAAELRRSLLEGAV